MSHTNYLQPWHWRSLPLNSCKGSEIFESLFLNTGNIATLLESPPPTSESQPQLARYSICAGDPRRCQGILQMWTPAVGKILPFLNKLLSKQKNLENSLPSHLPFTGGWLGWLGYDLAWEIEKLPRIKADPLPFPVAFWYEPATFAVLDHFQQTLWLAATDEAELDKLQQRLEKLSSSTSNTTKSSQEAFKPKDLPLLPTFPHYNYQAAIGQAKKYIQEGDIFQANLSLRFQASTLAESWLIYQTLRRINPSPFASYWQTPWGAVISCSPERLVKLQGQEAQTRPIAGTRKRGETKARDQQLEQELISDLKERAEHIMLVDLERNDLGRVCQWGSVKVNEFMTIERYSHVMHLVSNVTGILQKNCNTVDLIRALFPGGTITGCPKVRCLEIIEELEPVRRSLFYGSCGYLDQRGHLDLNILIRTLLVTNLERGLGFEDKDRGSVNSSSLKLVSGQVGAGIVADSDPEREWYESLHKAQAQLAALDFGSL